VGPDEVQVLNASSSPQLTLVTCYPFTYIGSAPDRFIVKANQIKGPRQDSATPLSAQR
jgi:sortase A